MRAVHSSRHVFGVKYKDRKTGKSLYQNQSEAVQDTVHPVGKYSSEGASIANGSTVVDIFLPPPCFKPVSLSLSRISSI